MTTTPHFPFFRPPQGAFPPDEVQITELRGEAEPDGRRVRVLLAVAPFQQPPHLSVTLAQAGAGVLAFTTIIEPVTQQITFNLHANPHLEPGDYTLMAELTYPETEISHSMTWTGTWKPTPEK
ncbi:MAG: hypothetical protein HPY76_11635 [Anaerolineae bacterium]|jgi:hypothetical protein|nr:hypothetical protein [Anaerolineae bacterium]